MGSRLPTSAGSGLSTGGLCLAALLAVAAPAVGQTPQPVWPDAARVDGEVGEYTLTAADIPDNTPLTVSELIAYRIPGVHKPRNLAGRCPVLMSRFGFVHLFIVDGIRYREGCVLDELVPGWIAEVRVIVSRKGQSRYGRPGGGVVIVRTKRSLDDGE